MDSEEISYRFIRNVQETEKKSPSLSTIHEKFYQSIAQYIISLKDRLGKESSEQKKLLLRDEIENTEKIAYSIYEFREKKILLAAISKIRGGNPNIKNLVSGERKLFESILELLKKTRKQILEVDTRKNQYDDLPNEQPIEKNIEQNKNPIVQVTHDIPEFIGTDMKKYNLKKGDVISIPPDMKTMLSKKNVIRELKIYK
jgi:DNA replication initiation complex subunit (GINS family)